MSGGAARCRALLCTRSCWAPVVMLGVTASSRVLQEWLAPPTPSHNRHQVALVIADRSGVGQAPTAGQPLTQHAGLAPPSAAYLALVTPLPPTSSRRLSKGGGTRSGRRPSVAQGCWGWMGSCTTPSRRRWHALPRGVVGNLRPPLCDVFSTIFCPPPPPPFVQRGGGRAHGGRGHG